MKYFVWALLVWVPVFVLASVALASGGCANPNGCFGPSGGDIAVVVVFVLGLPIYTVGLLGMFLWDKWNPRRYRWEEPTYGGPAHPVRSAEARPAAADLARRVRSVEAASAPKPTSGQRVLDRYLRDARSLLVQERLPDAVAALRDARLIAVAQAATTGSRRSRKSPGRSRIDPQDERTARATASPTAARAEQPSLDRSASSGVSCRRRA